MSVEWPSEPGDVCNAAGGILCKWNVEGTIQSVEYRGIILVSPKQAAAAEKYGWVTIEKQDHLVRIERKERA